MIFSPEWDHWCPRYLEVDFFHPSGTIGARDIKGSFFHPSDIFTPAGPSVPEIFRGDFNFFFTQVGPSVPEIFKVDFFT